MHIDHLPIPFLPIDNSRHQHQCVPSHKIPYTSFVLGIMPRVCCQIKLERPGEREDYKDEGEAVQKIVGRHHGIGEIGSCCELLL